MNKRQELMVWCLGTAVLLMILASSEIRHALTGVASMVFYGIALFLRSLGDA